MQNNQKLWDLVWGRIVSDELNRTLLYSSKPVKLESRFSLTDMGDN